VISIDGQNAKDSLSDTSPGLGQVAGYDGAILSEGSYHSKRLQSEIDSASSCAPTPRSASKEMSSEFMLDPLPIDATNSTGLYTIQSVQPKSLGEIGNNNRQLSDNFMFPSPARAISDPSLYRNSVHNYEEESASFKSKRFKHTSIMPTPVMPNYSDSKLAYSKPYAEFYDSNSMVHLATASSSQYNIHQPGDLNNFHRSSELRVGCSARESEHDNDSNFKGMTPIKLRYEFDSIQRSNLFSDISTIPPFAVHTLLLNDEVGPIPIRKKCPSMR